MGQKINPTGLRVGIIRDWDAKWYAEKEINQRNTQQLHDHFAIFAPFNGLLKLSSRDDGTQQ